MGDDRKVLAGERARAAVPPSPERLDELSRAVAEGRYRVAPEKVAEALLASLRARAPGR